MSGSMFEGYNNLTVSDKVFMIADEFLHKNEDELSTIFAISGVTVRSRRSKIKKKKIDTEPDFLNLGDSDGED
jgi:hypothetical protein